MWKEISKNRLQKDMDGFLVVKPKDGAIPVPLFCPLCHSAMKNSQDAYYYRKWECCADCGIEHAEPNRVKWKEGWRPKL